MASRGVTYTAWGKCIKEAENSARSARNFGFRTCLIAPAYKGDVFDRFIKTGQELTYPAQKVFVHHLSPWDETLYLDSDTLILHDVTFGFDMARKYGIALSIAPACFAKHHWEIENIPEDLPDYNSGVFFFNRHHPKMRNFWHIFQGELKNCLQYRYRPDSDQPALSILLYKKGINPYVLPQNWNLRPQYGMINGYGPIKIWHSRTPIPKNFNTKQKGWWTLEGKGPFSRLWKEKVNCVKRLQRF